jgi:lipopolysaccharide export system protein LptA
MVYDSAALKVTFSGDVRVRHPDFTLKSERLILYLREKQADAPARESSPLDAGAVDRIIAENNVDIQLPEGRTANCAKATYTVEKETLLMEGNPVLREGGNQIRGDKMIFYLRENRNEVQGRVAVDFVSGGASGNGDGVSGLGNMLNSR